MAATDWTSNNVPYASKTTALMVTGLSFADRHDVVWLGVVTGFAMRCKNAARTMRCLCFITASLR
jgi:hypothetical protein